MESIDRMREYLDENVRKLPHTEWIPNEPMEVRPSRLYGYLDAIEAETHELERFKELHREPFIEMEGFVERLREAVDAGEGVTLWGVDYDPLPVDASGEAIHVGDAMEWPDGEAFEVVAIGGGTLYYVDEPGGEVGWTGVEGKRHHVRQAVVDVLREFGDWYAHTKGGCDEDGVLAEYAAKLRLAEEG